MSMLKKEKKKSDKKSKETVFHNRVFEKHPEISNSVTK